MSTLTDKAWESLQNDETVFEVGVCTFNGCNVKVIKRQEPYHYVTKTGVCSKVNFPHFRLEKGTT